MSSCIKHSCFWRYLAVPHLSDFVAVTLESFSGGGSDNQGEGLSPNSSIAGQRGPTLGLELELHTNPMLAFFFVRRSMLFSNFPRFGDIFSLAIRCYLWININVVDLLYVDFISFVDSYCARSLLVAGISTSELRHLCQSPPEIRWRIIFRSANICFIVAKSKTPKRTDCIDFCLCDWGNSSGARISESSSSATWGRKCCVSLHAMPFTMPSASRLAKCG